TIREKKLVDATGKDIYLPHLAERMDLPITFVHGSENQCFKPESTEISFNTLKSLNPGQRYSRHVVDGYGHIDCIFGKNAYRDVYPYMLEHLESFS
ncbi:MAG TPA: hypothetical protein VKR32_02355, partial [Puia sp.]|nr:hypothetical protein [Puia sp.]